MNDVFDLIRWEAEILADYVEILKRYLPLQERYVREGGLWGDEADEHIALCDLVAGLRAFPPVPWWRPGFVGEWVGDRP